MTYTCLALKTSCGLASLPIGSFLISLTDALQAGIDEPDGASAFIISSVREQLTKMLKPY